MIEVERESEGQDNYERLYDGNERIAYKDFFVASGRLPIRFQVWTIPPGGSEGVHAHTEHEDLEEIYYVMEGTARYSSGGQSVELTGGDAVRAPTGIEHGIENSGAGDLRLVVIYGKATGPHQPV